MQKLFPFCFPSHVLVSLLACSVGSQLFFTDFCSFSPSHFPGITENQDVPKSLYLPVRLTVSAIWEVNTSYALDMILYLWLCLGCRFTSAAHVTTNQIYKWTQFIKWKDKFVAMPLPLKPMNSIELMRYQSVILVNMDGSH